MTEFLNATNMAQSNVPSQNIDFHSEIVPGFNNSKLSFLGSTIESMSGLTAFGLTMLIFYASTKVLNFYEIGPNIYGSYVVFYIFLLIAIYNIPRYPLIK
jgi:hypothetical protein